jgi:hypothetical protein
LFHYLSRTSFSSSSSLRRRLRLPFLDSQKTNDDEK